MITRVIPAEDEDPVLGQFLRLLVRDIASQPQRLAEDTDIQRLDSLEGVPNR